MRTRIASLIISIFLCRSVLHAQTTVTAPGQPQTATSQQAATVLSQVQAALAGAVAVADVTLTGAAERIVGGDDETGSVTYKATGGSNRLDLSFASGTTTEIRTTTITGVSGNWIDPKGVSHPMVGHNLMTDVGWFPQFTIGGITSSSNSLLSYVGLETTDSGSVIHITAWQQLPTASTNPEPLPLHLTQTEIYVDPSTFLPSVVAYNIHPDNNALVDIPVEIHFSDYRVVNGVNIPFHVQRFLTNGLYLDLQFQNAVVNSGITINSF
jgi:hypothetical protein